MATKAKVQPAITIPDDDDDEEEAEEVAAPGLVVPKRVQVLGWEDLDGEDEGDPLMVSEYVVEIFDYMRDCLEPASLPNSNYIEQQKELDWHMRAVLIDWLIEVQWKVKLLPETLFLSINLIDRFLSKRQVSLVKLQLVGLAATLLAAKYEEVTTPCVSNFTYLADNAYDEQELLKAERYMLHVLDFSLAYPNPLLHLRRISKADGYDVRTRTLSKYLMEVALLDHRFVACPPSMLAAVAVYTARLMLLEGEPLWNVNLAHYAGGFVETHLHPWSQALLQFMQTDLVKYEAVGKKYACKKLMKASSYVAEWLKKKQQL